MYFKNKLIESSIKNNKPQFIITNEDYDTIKSKFGNYDRGLDTIKPGLMFLLQLTSFGDSEFIDADKIKNKQDRIDKTKEILLNASKMPAIVLSKNSVPDGSFDYPTYEIAFWTKSHNGEGSGLLRMKEVCIWRYFGGDHKNNQEGALPNWFIDMWRDETEDIVDGPISLSPKELFYIKDGEEVYIN